jgi:hypothetical protein
MQFGFVASWQSFRNAVREMHFFLVHDDHTCEDIMFSPRFIDGDFGSPWKQCVD